MAKTKHKRKKQIITAVSICFDPQKQDEEVMAEQFTDVLDYDGGGYCFMTGYRDVTFFGDETADLKQIKQIARRARRRKGVIAVTVDQYEDVE